MNDINDFKTSIDLFVETCCDLFDSYQSYSELSSFMLEATTDSKKDTNPEDEKIEVILSKASKNNSSRLIKSFKKPADRVANVDKIVSEISDVKVYIADTWSFKKYIDKEIDGILKDGSIESVYGKFFLTEIRKGSKIDKVESQIKEMTKIMRMSYKVSIDKQGRISEEERRRDPIRDTGIVSAANLTSGFILNFLLGKPLKNTIYKNLYIVSGGMDAVSSSHPILKAKRKLNGTYGTKYETVTIGQLYKRLKELDPNKFGQVSDNEINIIRNFFIRNKKMNRLSRINADSSQKAIRLAGKMVNLQAEYSAYRDALANYYIRIINRSYAIVSKASKSDKE